MGGRSSGTTVLFRHRVFDLGHLFVAIDDSTQDRKRSNLLLGGIIIYDAKRP